MDVREDTYGHVTVFCGWHLYENERPDTEDNIIVLEHDELMSLANYDESKKKWVNSADDTDLNIKWWMRIPEVPQPDEEDE